MPKRLLEDIVVRVPRTKQEVVRREPEESRQESAQKEIRPSKRPEEPGVSRGRPVYMLWFIALVSATFCFFAISFWLTKAEVVANPKTQDIVLSQNFSAGKNSVNNLSFDLMAIAGEETVAVQTSGEKDVSEKATGAVMIYNTFGSSPQTLDVDARLEGTNGKINKEKTRVVVPGKSKGGVPGSVEAGIYAAEAGEEYNSEPLDFKIFGFKGTPKYSKFYARSKGAITGGLEGKLLIISDSQKASVINEMKTNLQIQLFKKATDQIPSGFILFKDAVFLDTDPNSIDFTSSKDNLLPIKLKGTLYGILFDEQKLSKKIALDSIENYDDSGVYLPNIRDLTFSLSSKNNNSFADVKNIEFNLSGPAKIVWRFDGDKLAGELLGKSKKDFNQILAQYSNVDSAESQLSPFWKMSFPNKIKNIKVIVNYPK